MHQRSCTRLVIPAPNAHCLLPVQALRETILRVQSALAAGAQPLVRPPAVVPDRNARTDLHSPKFLQVQDDTGAGMGAQVEVAWQGHGAANFGERMPRLEPVLPDKTAAGAGAAVRDPMFLHVDQSAAEL
jgi:hypothetical protein